MYRGIKRDQVLPFDDSVVWSNEGPVPNEPVLPACLLQLKVSFASCVKSQRPVSKLHLQEIE